MEIKNSYLYGFAKKNFIYSQLDNFIFRLFNNFLSFFPLNFTLYYTGDFSKNLNFI
jgi:hypothetical protein